MQPKKKRKLKLSVPIGGLFILFSIVGIITIILVNVKFTKSLMDNKKQKEMLQSFIQPVVMFDPAAFSSPSEIDNQRLLLYSMWSTLSSEDALRYKRSKENESLLVLASDVNASAKRLFGKDVNLEHISFTDNEAVYFYDEANAQYEVPTNGELYVYAPEILTIAKSTVKSKDGYDLYILLVSYIAPDNAWSKLYVGGKDQGAKKYMVYTVEDSDTGWHIVSLDYPPADILATIPGAVVDDVYVPPALPDELPSLGYSNDTYSSSNPAS